MPDIIQFIHPGPQPRFRGATKPWNLIPAKHVRCFLESDGDFMAKLGEEPQAGTLQFWGEWEPAARVVARLKKPPNRAWPRCVLAPSYPARPPPLAAHNTDPFVFDGPFLYSNCRQERCPRLRHLSRGSIVLFGSNLDRKFVLDTVFVVSGSQQYRVGARLPQLGTVPPSFVDATLAVLQQRAQGQQAAVGARGCGSGAGGCGGGTDYTLYWGATPAAPVEGMFSFAPAKRAGEAPIGFPRPQIRLTGAVTPTLRQGIKATAWSMQEAQEHWAAVVKQVLESGCVLGTKFDLPAP